MLKFASLFVFSWTANRSSAHEPLASYRNSDYLGWHMIVGCVHVFSHLNYTLLLDSSTQDPFATLDYKGIIISFYISCPLSHNLMYLTSNCFYYFFDRKKKRCSRATYLSEKWRFWRWEYLHEIGLFHTPGGWNTLLGYAQVTQTFSFAIHSMPSQPKGEVHMNLCHQDIQSLEVIFALYMCSVYSSYQWYSNIGV